MSEKGVEENHDYDCPTCKAQKENKVIDREAAGQLSLLDRGKTL